MQTLSLEVGGWRKLRKRSHMRNYLPWVLIATTQDEAADAAHFQYSPTVTHHPMLSCFLLQRGIWIIHQQHSSSGLVTQPWSKSCTWSIPSSSLFIKNRFRQAKSTDFFPLLPMSRFWRAFSHKGSWLRCSTEVHSLFKRWQCPTIWRIALKSNQASHRKGSWKLDTPI